MQPNKSMHILAGGWISYYPEKIFLILKKIKIRIKVIEDIYILFFHKALYHFYIHIKVNTQVQLSAKQKHPSD